MAFAAIFLLWVLLGIRVGGGSAWAASTNEWSLGPSDEFTTAFINITYYDANSEKILSDKSESGKYGIGRIVGASGLVVHVHSIDKPTVHHGCDFPFGNNLPNEPWVALIQRGSCNFDRKLENAYRMNASAMLVYDREAKDNLERMGLKNCNNCDIPGIFTFKWKGEEIAQLVDSGVQVYMFISVGETCTHPYTGINRTSVLFVSISFIVLMIISLAWLVFYYIQRFRYLHAKDRLAQRLCNAAKKALAKIPTRSIKLSDKELVGEGECCAVCIELYRSGDILRTLPCKHEFHKGCVDPWLLEHRTCPMCKMDILKFYGFIFTGSQESILHLDMEEGLNSSEESRGSESPAEDVEIQVPPEMTASIETPPTTECQECQPSQEIEEKKEEEEILNESLTPSPTMEEIPLEKESEESKESIPSENTSLPESNEKSE